MNCCGLNNFRYSLPPACSGCQALRGDQIVESELLGSSIGPPIPRCFQPDVAGLHGNLPTSRCRLVKGSMPEAGRPELAARPAPAAAKRTGLTCHGCSTQHRIRDLQRLRCRLIESTDTAVGVEGRSTGPRGWNNNDNKARVVQLVQASRSSSSFQRSQQGKTGPQKSDQQQ